MSRLRPPTPTMKTFFASLKVLGIAATVTLTSCHEPYPTFDSTVVESLPTEILLAIQKDFPDSTILGQHIRSFKGRSHIYAIDVEDNKGLVHGTLYDMEGLLQFDKVYDDHD